MKVWRSANVDEAGMASSLSKGWGVKGRETRV